MKLNPFALLLTLLAVSPVHAAETTGPLPLGKFVNAIGEGADPWVVRDPNEPRYLWCYSDGNRGIALRTGDKLSTLAPGKTVWQAPDTGPYSHGIWAPELHFIDNRWHIYFAADAGSNASHLAYVLRAKTADPFGEYDLHGPLATGDGSDGMSPNVWGIDMTPMEFNGSLYAIWSGWDAPGSDKQYLYIAPMNSGVEITAGPRVRICSNNTYPWEYTNGDGTGRGLNEGAEVLQYGGRTFVTYSCGTSLKPTYKLGMLELTGSDPLDPASWVKFPEPVFQGTENVFGAGHSCFVTSPDGTEWWHVYHTKIATSSDWKRRIHIQPFQFNAAGLPQFGIPIPTRTELDVPSGETTSSTIFTSCSGHSTGTGA